MSKKFDLKKVEAALKQAAKTAISGTRLERSGRFLVGVEEKPAAPGVKRG